MRKSKLLKIVFSISIFILTVFCNSKIIAQNDFVLGVYRSYGFSKDMVTGHIVSSINKTPTSSYYSSIYTIYAEDGFNTVRTYMPNIWTSMANYKRYIELLKNNGLKLIDDNTFFYKTEQNSSTDGTLSPYQISQCLNVYSNPASNVNNAIYNYEVLYSDTGLYRDASIANNIWGHVAAGESNDFHWYPNIGNWPTVEHSDNNSAQRILEYSFVEVPPDNVSAAIGQFQLWVANGNTGQKIINTQAFHGGSYLNSVDNEGIYSVTDFLNLTNKGDLFIEASYFSTQWSRWKEQNIPNLPNSVDYLGKYKSIDYAKNYYTRVLSEICDAYVVDQYDLKDYVWYTNRNIHNGNHIWFQAYTSIIHGATGIIFYKLGDDYNTEDANDLARLTEIKKSNLYTYLGTNNFVFANESKSYQDLLSNLSKELRYLIEKDLLTDNPASVLYTKTTSADVNGILPSSTTYLLPKVSAANAQDLIEYTNNQTQPNANTTSFINNHRGEDYGLRYTVRTNGDEVIMIITNPNPYSITLGVTLNFNNLTNQIIEKSTGVNVLFESPQSVISQTYKTDREWVDRQIFIDNISKTTTPNFDVIKCNMKQYPIQYASPSDKKISLNFGPFDVKVLKFGGEDITTNTTWNSDKLIENDIIVESGNTLTITSTIKMLPNVKVIVKEGGKLIIDGGTLTSVCENLWKGILVQGDENYDQSDETKQGVLEMKNGATIENAEVAVYVGKYFIDNSQSPLPSNYGNGKIKISNSNFINNQRDIVMRPNAISLIGGNSNTLVFNSFVLHTIFKNDANIPTDNILNKGKMGNIYLNGILNLTIQGNTFENLDNTLSVIDRGIGIDAINSSFNILPYENPLCPTCSAISNKFINLYKGISCINPPNSNCLVEINKNEFTNTYRAIFLSGTNDAEVLENTIQAENLVAVQSGQPDPGQPYGIYLLGGKGFRVEENTIYRPSSNGPANFNGSRGIIVHNTGGVNNEIYHNILTNLFISNQAQIYNSGQGVDAALGLKFLCNNSQTTQSSYDFQTFGNWYLVKDKPFKWSWHQSGIAEFQQQKAYDPVNIQYVDAPAANQFSSDHLTNETTVFDFDNADALKVKYGWGNLTSTGEKWKPTEVANLDIVPLPVSQGVNVCPSKITSGGNGTTLSQLYANLGNAYIAYNSSNLIFNIWKDGGISDLGEEVATTDPWDAYVQFNSLLAESPYLSEDVIIEFINNPVFSSLMVKLLVIANPHCIDNPKIMDVLKNRIPAMPQSYIDEIRNQPEVSSQYKLLEGNVAADYHLISNIGEDIKRMYRNNQEDSWAKDSLIAFVSRQPDMYDKFELATIYLSYGQYEAMDDLLNNISNIYEMDEEKTAELSEFSTVINIAKVLEQENLYETSLTDTQRSNLESIMDNNNPITAPFALSILKRDNPGYLFEETVFDVEQNSARMASPSTTTTEHVEGGRFKIYPNPAKDYTTLSYNCKFANMSYSILDMQGKMLITKSLITIEDKVANEVLVDLSNLSNGSYQMIINTNNTALWSEKLIKTE